MSSEPLVSPGATREPDSVKLAIQGPLSGAFAGFVGSPTTERSEPLGLDPRRQFNIARVTNQGENR